MAGPVMSTGPPNPMLSESYAIGTTVEVMGPTVGIFKPPSRSSLGTTAETLFLALTKVNANSITSEGLMQADNLPTERFEHPCARGGGHDGARWLAAH